MSTPPQQVAWLIVADGFEETLAVKGLSHHELHGGWVFAGQLGFDFRVLTAQQTRRIAPFVVEAAWRRGMGPLLLIHGGRRSDRAGELRKQWVAGDWLIWSPHRRSKRHGVHAEWIVLALRSHRSPSWDALPNFEPGHADFDGPRRAASAELDRLADHYSRGNAPAHPVPARRSCQTPPSSAVPRRRNPGTMIAPWMASAVDSIRGRPLDAP